MAEAQIPQDNDKVNEASEDEKWAKLKQEREEYLKKLRKWLNEARLSHYNACSGFPFNNVNTEGNHVNPQLLQQQQLNNINATLAQANLWNESLQNILRQRHTAANRNGVNPPYATTVSSQTNQRPSTYEFVIPPLWKRMVAELMDFFILFLVKMALTFILLESFDIIDMEFYGFESFQKNLENPEVAMPMAIEWLTLEFLHRLIVCTYETYFLKGKFFATPGKRYMGLMVITVENMSPVPGRMTETISATGAAPLGWQKSLTRAAMKNLFVGLLLPLCVAFYIFPHNRTSYDMMSNSIVVEYHQEFMVYHSTI
ncbi:protein FAM8A1 [Anoplophora glabripennis]|uniref:protein FAM8A1 n=1 Tax=Anoplophora glabripennis TaxID=217634 RepID=UPI000875313E|nr:protein FAM8A1 [Anoplophora glabripennis]